MYINNLKKSLIIAVATLSIALGGCSGNSDSDMSDTSAASEESAAEESTAEENTVGSSTNEPRSESTEESAEETAVEVIEINIENETESETEEPSETETSTESDTSSTNHVVVLDPGHGGALPGAQDGEYQEKDLTLKMAFYCRDYLLEHYDGVTVYLTRETDMHFSTDQSEDLEERVHIAADYGAEIMVSLHFNSDSTNTANGALVCVSKQPEVHDEAAALGTSILNQLAALGLRNRGLLYMDSTEYFDENGEALDYYAICRYSASYGFVGIIVEHCFMRNEIDRQFYTSDEAVMNLAVADAIGIAQYLGLSEKES